MVNHRDDADPWYLAQAPTASATRTCIVAANAEKRYKQKQFKHKENGKRIKRMRNKKKRIAKLKQSDFTGYSPFVNPVEFEKQTAVENKFYRFEPRWEMRCIENKQGHGYIHFMDESKTTPGLILLPKAGVHPESLELGENKIPFLESLQRVGTNTKREKARTGHSESNGIFVTLGVTVTQDGRLIRSSVLRMNDEQLEKNDAFPKAHMNEILRLWVAHVVHQVKSYLPSRQIDYFENLGKYLNNKPDEQFPRTALFQPDFPVGAIASAVDYSAPAHTDPKDFGLSIHQLNVEGRHGDEVIAQYFCFPTLKLAIALRPGDILVFNPSIHHCLSKKSVAYQGNRVHVSTFYTKYGHASLNNNSIPLTADEKVQAKDLNICGKTKK